MEVNNTSIQMAQVDAWRPPATSKNKANAPALNSSVSSGNQGMTASGSNINYIKSQLDAILYSYPPFFPPGSPQRFDLIKSGKGVQEKIEKASIPHDRGKNPTDPKLTAQATDKNIFGQNAATTASKESGLVINIKT
jgi:hypothetical protein